MKFADARKYKKEIKKLYREAFPADERAPLFLLFKRTDNGRDKFSAILDDNNNFTGLIYTISTDRLKYVFFFAITNENRGKGYGTEVLKKLREENSEKTVILMIEDPELENAPNTIERVKRLEFYEKNGFLRLGIKINEAGVAYELLGTQNNVKQSDFLMLMKDWGGAFLFKILYRKTKRL
jgi:GNAT superfamily N-acetyltransferase